MRYQPRSSELVDETYILKVLFVESKVSVRNAFVDEFAYKLPVSGPQKLSTPISSSRVDSNHTQKTSSSLPSSYLKLELSVEV